MRANAPEYVPKGIAAPTVTIQSSTHDSALKCEHDDELLKNGKKNFCRPRRRILDHHALSKQNKFAARNHSMKNHFHLNNQLRSTEYIHFQGTVETNMVLQSSKSKTIENDPFAGSTERVRYQCHSGYTKKHQSSLSTRKRGYARRERLEKNNEPVLLSNEDTVRTDEDNFYCSNSLERPSDSKDSPLTLRAEGTWSAVAYKGHQVRLALDLLKLQEYQRQQEEQDTFMRMEKLGLSRDDSVRTDKYDLESRSESSLHSSSLSLLPFNIKDTRKSFTTDKIKQRWQRILTTVQDFNKIRSEATKPCDDIVLSTTNSSFELDIEQTGHLNVTSNIDFSVGYKALNLATDSCESLSTNEYKDSVQSSKQLYPLHQAMLQNDEKLLKYLLENSVHRKVVHTHCIDIDDIQSQINNKTYLHAAKLGLKRVSAFTLAILLDLPHIVRVVFGYSINILEIIDMSAKDSPLFLAATLALDESLRILLSLIGKSGVFYRHTDTGDTILHMACRNRSISTVQAILSFICEKRRSGTTLFQTLACHRNNKGETPLHVACSVGNIRIVESLLNACTASCGAKLLKMLDENAMTPLLTAVAHKSTDVVIHLLMWRGNHRDCMIAKNVPDSETQDTILCPLNLAVSIGSFHMVTVLIDFGDPSRTAAAHIYDYQQALFRALLSFNEDSYEGHETIKLLIENGANPHKSCSLHADIVSLENTEVVFDPMNSNDEPDGLCSKMTTPLTVAMERGMYKFIRTMLDVYDIVLRRSNETRRLDPLVKQQPETYFISIESRAEGEVTNSVQRSLLKCLLISSRKSSYLSTASVARLSSALALLRRRNSLTDIHLNLLIEEIMVVKGAKHRKDGTLKVNFMSASYEHPYLPITAVKDDPSSKDASKASGWSTILTNLEWFSPKVDEVYCEWMRCQVSKSGFVEASPTTRDEDIFVISCNDGSKIKAHKTIVSFKSKKLDAAIRFEALRTKCESSSSTITVCLDISSDIAKLILTHCYHGSIVTGLPTDQYVCCQKLLELSSVAEEYLCTSLLRECEFRLTSENPYSCYCWNCCSERSLTSDNTIICWNRTTANGRSKLLDAESILPIFATTIDESCIFSLGFRYVVLREVFLQFDDILKSEVFLSHFCDVIDENNGLISSDVPMRDQIAILLLHESINSLSDIVNEYCSGMTLKERLSKTKSYHTLK